MAYIVEQLVFGNSSRQWRIVKGEDSDQEFVFPHDLGFSPLCIPIITNEANNEAELIANKIASPCITSVDAFNITGRMLKESGTAGARSIITVTIPMI